MYRSVFFPLKKAYKWKYSLKLGKVLDMAIQKLPRI